MLIRRWISLLIPPIVLLLASCDSVRPVDFEEQAVVEAYLIAGEGLPMIRLSRPVPMGAAYDYDEQALPGAMVHVHRLDEEGNIEATYPFAESARDGGFYRPLPAERVRPLTRYRLEVLLPGDEGTLEAETLVPGSFDLIAASHDTIRYQSESQLELTLSSAAYPGRQSIYIFTTQSFEPTFENLTPVYRALVEAGDLDAADLRLGTSGLMNEANFDVISENQVLMRLPWLAVPFYGPSRVNINAIDDNLYDFLRSHSVQQGGSTLPPGEIPNVIDHIDGGKGIFGSYARVWHDLVVLREDAD